MNNSAILVVSLATLLGGGGCAYSTAPTTDTPDHSIKNTCIGTSTVPEALANQFVTTDDTALLNRALGEPNKGTLCQGQVYISEQDSQITLFRAWNSTTPIASSVTGGPLASPEAVLPSTAAIMKFAINGRH